MKLILSLCLLLAPAFGWTQIEYNQVKRLSKAEFKKLKLERDKFIPLGLKNSSVLIVKCSKESYKQMRRVALLKSLVRNSYDTTAIDKDSRFNELSHNDDNHEKTTGLVSD
ncbi:MAG: hypothetical protein HY015_10705, partial [Bacteroidetes bacterium]|nr:hypothetical protein [Bacteroidota bacterium]